MAEVISKAGSGVNLTPALQTPQVNPTVGTEGRVTPARLDLSGLVNAVQSFAIGNEKRKKNEAEAQVSSLAQQAAIEEEAVNFELRAGDPAQVIERLAKESAEDTGEEMPAGVRKRLVSMNTEFQRLSKMFAQIPEADRERRINAAMRLHRIRFLTEHPQYGLEALVASGKLDKIEAQSEFADEQDARKRRNDAAESLRTFYRGRGIEVDPNVDLKTMVDDYNARYAAERQQYLANDQALKSLTTRFDLDEKQRQVAKEEYLRVLRPGNIKGTGEFLTSQILDQSTPAETRIANIEGYWTALLRRLGEQEGLSDPKEIEKRYGVLFTLKQQSIDVINNKGPTEAIVAQIKLTDAAAERIIQRQMGPNWTTLKVMEQWAPYIGPALSQQVFTPAQPGKPETLGNKVLNLFANNLASAPGMATDPYQPLTQYRLDTVDPSPVTLRQGEQAVGSLNRLAVDSYAQLSPEAKQKAVDQWEATIMSPYAAESATAWADVMDVMDSPNFDEFLVSAGRKPEVDGQAVSNTRTYVRALLAHMDAINAPEGSLTWNPATRELVPDGSKLSLLPMEERNSYILAARRLSQATRVLQQRLGQRPDDASPGTLLQEIMVAP